MQEDKLKQLLYELYELDPSLKEHEASVIKLITRMEEIKPDTKFDETFVAELRSQIMKAERLAEKSNGVNKIFNYNYMNKKIYLAAGSLVVASLLFVAFISFFPKSTNTPSARFSFGDLIDRTVTEERINKLEAGAFGSLATLGSLGGAESDLARTLSAAPEGFGAVSAEGMASVKSFNTFDSAVSTEEMMVADRMIMPFWGYRYIYEGEELNLTETSANVYRRIKGQNDLARSLANHLNSVGFSEISLNAFENLKVTNFTLAEDKDLGLLIAFNFIDDTVSVYENWERWRDPVRDNCVDQACWDRYRLKINDVPADNELITIANNFLSKHQVSLENYGEPRVDNYWRAQYEETADKANFYIPESAGVIYPLLINGQEVRDQSGGYAGLRVSINLFKRAASGLYGLVPYRYESSAYALETDSAEIIKSAENGGFSRNYWIQDQVENVPTISLGTPTRAYVQIYRWENGRNDELLVPALIFPIISRPENYSFYFGQRYVIVPLVKDILAELNKPSDWFPGDNVIRPMPYIEPAGGTSAGQATPPSSGAGVDGVVTEDFRILPVIEPAIEPKIITE